MNYQTPNAKPDHERIGFGSFQDMKRSGAAMSFANDLAIATRKGMIETIKTIRAHTGLGLKESKDLAEALRDSFYERKVGSGAPSMHTVASTLEAERRSENNTLHVVTWYGDGDFSARMHPTRDAAERHAVKVVEEAAPHDDPGPVRIARVVAVAETTRKATIRSL